jgi:hypothetical protein
MTPLREQIEGIIKEHSKDDYCYEASWTDYDWDAIYPKLESLLADARREAVEEACKLIVTVMSRMTKDAGFEPGLSEEEAVKELTARILRLLSL